MAPEGVAGVYIRTWLVRKESVAFSSPKVAHLYAGLSLKTLIRDLNWLTARELAVHSPAGYHANLALLEAFTVPGAPFVPGR